MVKRQTAQRLALEEVFRRDDRPLGVEEILQNGQEIVKTLNKATVYRNLKVLVEDGWLTQINHPGLGVLYERAGKEHHHHFHCRHCDRVFEMPGCPLSAKYVTPPGFITEGHEVFLFGICPACIGQEQL